MKKLITLLCGICCSVGAMAQVSLDECQRLAKENYPLIRQYALIEATTSYSVSNAKRSYLPQVSLSGQATYQSDVMAFPERFGELFSQMGMDMKGLNKDQYRVNLDVNQNIWDGGRSKAQQKLSEAEGEISYQNIEIEMYAIRERVNALYLGVLMLEEQLAQNRLLQELLESNHKKIEALVKNGAAMQSDLDALSVELLSTGQQRVEIEANATAYRKMLALFTGKKSLSEELLIKPSAQISLSNEVKRPELQLLDAQISGQDAQKRLVNSSTKPQFGAFAQGFYGNPGLNMFQDMISNTWTWNYMVGVKVLWNFGGYYTKKNNIKKISTVQQQLDNRRETFLFNTSLQISQEQAAINKMRQVMTDDDKIIALRTSIRKAAEARLENGVIDVNDLLREITAESTARLAKAAHEIELLKNIYDFKNTIND